MGLWDGNLLYLDEIKELSKGGLFSFDEIKGLYERFKYLDRSNSGHLSFAEFHLIPEFYSNPFSHLIMKYLEKRFCYEKITFSNFVEFLSIFNFKTVKEKRIEFLFKIFDLKDEKKLTPETLKEIKFLMTKEDNIDELEILEIFKNYDTNTKGYLNFNDFIIFYNDDPTLDKNLIIDFRKDIIRSKIERFWDIFWPFKSKKKKNM